MPRAYFYLAFFSFFLPGGLLHKQGPRRARLRGAPPLPHSHNALVATSYPALCVPLQEGQVGNQETPHNTEGLPLFSRGAVRASW